MQELQSWCSSTLIHTLCKFSQWTIAHTVYNVNIYGTLFTLLVFSVLDFWFGFGLFLFSLLTTETSSSHLATIACYLGHPSLPQIFRRLLFCQDMTSSTTYEKVAGFTAL